jgi:hypothetical protein
MVAKFDTKHREAINNIVAGTEQASRYLLKWVEDNGQGAKIYCATPVCSRQLARRIVHELFLHDDNVTKIDLKPIS